MAVGEMAVCAAPNCKELFKKKTQNHLYHSKACKREVENASKRRQLVEDIADLISPGFGLVKDEVETVDFLRKEVQRLGRELDKTKLVHQERAAAIHAAIRDGLNGFELPPIDPPSIMFSEGSEEVAVVVLSDIQLSKVTPTYNSEVAEERVYKYIEEVIRLTDIQRMDHPIRECHVWCLGDIIEGAGIFAGQSLLVDAGFYRQVTIHGPRILANALRRLLENFEYVEVHCVIGNHGRMGSRAKEEFDPESNGDRMLYRIMDHIFATEDRIRFVIPDGPRERNWFDVDTIGNYSCLLFHGDQFQSFTSMYSIGRRLLGYKQAIDMEWRDACIGHFHQSMKLTFGKTVLRVGGTTESDNTYAQEVLASTGGPSQLLMFVDPLRGVVTSEHEVSLV